MINKGSYDFQNDLWKIKLIDNNNNNKIDGNRGYYV